MQDCISGLNSFGMAAMSGALLRGEDVPLADSDLLFRWHHGAVLRVTKHAVDREVVGPGAGRVRSSWAHRSAGRYRAARDGSFARWE